MNKFSQKNNIYQDQKYTESVRYEYLCIFCHSTDVWAVINDGGSLQHCKKCDKSYKALIKQPVTYIDQKNHKFM